MDDAFVGRGLLKIKASPEDIDGILRTKARLPFIARFIAEFTRERTKIEATRQNMEELEAAKAETISLIKGSRGHDCFLLRLPLPVRAIIWKMVFQASESFFFDINPSVPGLSMLRVSKTMNLETSIAFADALVSRIMVLVLYPDHCYLGQPLPIIGKVGDRIFREINLPLGDKIDPRMGMQRTLDFVHFARTMAAHHPIMTFELIIHIESFWKVPQIGFDEDMLAVALTGGAFAFIKRIRVIGNLAHANMERLGRSIQIQFMQQ